MLYYLGLDLKSPFTGKTMFYPFLRTDVLKHPFAFFVASDVKLIFNRPRAQKDDERSMEVQTLEINMPVLLHLHTAHTR